MRKLVLGLLLLAALFCACFANTVFLKMELSLMKSNIEESLSLQKEDAYVLIYGSHRRWEDLRPYTDFIFCETKSDAITSLFIDSMEYPDDNAIKKQLIYHLDSSINNEMMNLGSVF